MTFAKKRTSISTSANSVETEYAQRLSHLQAGVSSAKRRQSMALFGLITCLILTLVSVAWREHTTYLTLSVLPLVGATIALREYLKWRARALEYARRSGFYEHGLDRLRGAWQTTELTGEEFERENHLYQFDLQILGKSSLFALLCTTRSQAGAARLASYLLDPADLAEATSRQEAVRELVGETGLREEIALLGEYQFHECDRDTLDEWIKTPALSVHPWVHPWIRGALFTCSATTLIVCVMCFAGILSWLQGLPVLLLLLAAQTTTSSLLFRGVQPRLKKLRLLTAEFSVLQRGLALLQSQKFTSRRLKTLVRTAQQNQASLNVQKLEHLLWAIAQREKELLYVPSLLLSAGTQLVLAVESWRAQHRGQLEEWTDCWAEFEALNAIACYAYEHPADVFPDLIAGTAVLEAEDIGHPLLPAETCVRNDVSLHEPASAFYVVSGSNMAGKSTFLKAVGVNTVLALAGAPVRAERARLSSFTICASNSISDSLLNEKSKFLAEAERLREALRCTGSGKPVLFLIDEILSGTNSHDRRIACESIVRALVAGGAVGILSTHDLSLTEIAHAPGMRGLNYHMESPNPGDPLTFDYRVKAGIARHSNALAILEMLGIH